MPAPCDYKNPLQHSGTSRVQRVIRALQPDFVQIDGRTDADLILFAKEYAGYLNYYDLQNQTDGNWQPLMQMDIAVVLATLAHQDMQRYEIYKRGIYKEILDIDTNDATHLAGNTVLSRKLLETLFDLLFTWIYELDAQYGLLPSGSDEQLFLQQLIEGRLGDAYRYISAYYTACKNAPGGSLVNDTTLYAPLELLAPCRIFSTKQLLQNKLSNSWQSALPLPSIPELTGTDVLRKITNLVTHNLFNTIVDELLKSVGTVSVYADGALKQKLDYFPSHTPHYALFLTFLHLFRHEQNGINGLTKKHLDLYYKDILRLQSQDALPDQAHLILELQKNTDGLILPAGTAFKAGKDPDGKEIFYATERDFTVNRAKVTALKSVYINKNNPDFIIPYQSDIADSDDGQGAPLTSADKSWYPFGDPGKISSAHIGFAIASNHLYLAEGDRGVVISFSNVTGISTAEVNGFFSAKLTGEKGWISLKEEQVDVQVDADNTELSFTFSLDGSLPAIIGYNQKLHGGNFDTALPIVQLLCKIPQDNSFNPILKLSGLVIKEATLSVTVSGLKDLSVSTETGATDTSKPFMPFGTTPHTGSYFIIGSKEIFQKELTELGLWLEWDKLPTDGLAIFEKANFNLPDGTYRKHRAVISQLQKGQWVNETEERGLFTGYHLYAGNFFEDWDRPVTKYAQPENELDPQHSKYDIVYYPIKSPYPQATFDTLAPQDYSVESVSGFIRLELTGNDFGYEDYLEKVRNLQVKTDSSGTTTISLPKEPYVPVLKSIQAAYKATQTITTNELSSFYHITPFGYREIIITKDPSFTLLQEFQNEGELYIGLENVGRPQRVSLLVQVAEGSADPFKGKQPVTWSYLGAENSWQPFNSQDVEDHTNGLLQSGLIFFNLQPGSNETAALLPEGKVWISVSAEKDTDAICRIISIQSQGILTTFTDLNKTGNYYKAHVPAGTITKMVVSHALVKKITQPYDSSGGRVKEPDNNFYTRVSERLRHKQRAVTIWDYEHIILQQFPDIYKVKCLNHTEVKPATGNDLPTINELAPGHVTLVPVSNLQNKVAVDPLTPCTPISVLDDIKKYAKANTSPFICLHVVNPVFEQIQFDFKVRFFDEYDVNQYTLMLDKAITAFLSPWAYDSKKDIEFGGKLSKSVVLKFIEDQYYVDYVSCFKMNQYFGNTGVLPQKDIEEATASTPLSVLVSYHQPGKTVQHTINATNNATATCDCT